MCIGASVTGLCWAVLNTLLIKNVFKYTVSMYLIYKYIDWHAFPSILQIIHRHNLLRNNFKQQIQPIQMQKKLL